MCSGGSGFVDFETGVEFLLELTENPAAGDYLIDDYFRHINFVTGDQLEQAFAIVERSQPAAAELIQRKIMELYQFRALCVIDEVDPDIFFPEFTDDETKVKENETVAKAICAKCTVRDECLDYAIKYDEKFGVWGGLNEKERSRESRDRQLAGLDIDRLASEIE